MRRRDPNKEYYDTDGVPEYEGRDTKLMKAEQVILTSLQDEIKGKPVLDLGVGAGRTTQYLRAITADYVGADYSKKMIVLARRRHPDATFVLCDARYIPMVDNDFSAVFFWGAGMGGVMPPTRSLIFKEANRVLKKNGLFVFPAQNIDYGNLAGAIEFDFNLNLIAFLKDGAKQLCPGAVGIIIKLRRKLWGIGDAIGLEYAEFTRAVTPTYYISIETQVRQLLEAGFSEVTAVNMEGTVLKKGEKSTGIWVYYIARKA